MFGDRRVRLLFGILVLIFLLPGQLEAKKKGSSKKLRKTKDVKIESLKEGDYFYPKAALIFEPGEYKKPFENSSFDPGMKKAANGRCEVEMIRGSKDGRRALAKVQKIEKIETKEDTPKTTVAEFVKAIQKPTLDLFEEAVVLDEVEGIGFRNDDLKVKIPELMNQEPWIQVPGSEREKVSQSLFTHIWGYWGDISKFRKKDYSLLEKAKQKYLPIYSGKIFNDIERYLKRAEKAGQIASDQMTNYQVTLGAGAPQILKVSCQLEGTKKDFSLKRLNSMMSPYFEVIPKAEFSELDLSNNLPPKAVLPSGVEGL